MTTTQAAANGHCVSPPPFPVENPAELNSAVLPTNQDDINSNTLASPISDLPSPEARLGFPAGDYHVPPKPFAPKADSFRNTIPEGWGRTKLPDRCQFMFSDGRQSTMARSDIHPSLCVYHSDREEQLFGDPGQRCEARTLDFPELHSASRDLSTAAGVNRALAQVFRMLARGRISRQEAATFAKLGHLLLQTIFAMRAESAARADELSEYKEHMSPVVERQKGVPITSPLPQNENPVSASALHHTPRVSSSSGNVTETEAVAVPDTRQATDSNSRTINTSANCPSNSRKISTYEITRLNPLQNQHLRQNGEGILPKEADQR